MEIIPFFSFKGGVGRTQALLNVGAEIARRGKNVVLMDLDIHAPGLSIMECMRPLAEEQLSSPRPGILEFFEWLIQLAQDLKEGKAPPTPLFLPACAYIPQLASRLPQGSGSFKFIPCADLPLDASGSPPVGALEGYSMRLHKMESSLEEVFAKVRAQTAAEQRDPVIEQIRNQFLELPPGEQPDYILIDARTGITSIREMLFSVSVNRLVMVSGPNHQNLWGLRAALDALRQSLGHVPNWLRRVTFVLSPVPDGEEELKQERITPYVKLIQDYLDQEEVALFGSVGLLPTPVLIPYHAQLALIEDPILLRHPDSAPVSAYREIAERLGAKQLDPLEQIAKQKDEKDQVLGDAPWLPTVHPLARVLPWDAGLSAEESTAFVQQVASGRVDDGWVRHLLNYVANSISITGSDPALLTKVLESLRILPSEKIRRFLVTMREERTGFFLFSYQDWGDLAMFAARTRFRWHQELQKRLRHRMWPMDLWLSPAQCSAAEWGSYWTALAMELRLAGFREEAMEILLRGTSHFGGRPDFASSAVAEFMILDQYPKALDLCIQWLDRIGSSPLDAAKAWNARAKVHELLGQYPEQEAALRNAIKEAMASGDTSVLASTLVRLGELAFRRAELGKAAEHFEEARSRYEGLGDTLGLANTLRSLGELALRRAELGKAAEYLEEARQKYEGLGANLGLANTLKSLGDLAMRRAELGKAAEHLEEARQKYEVIGDSLGLANTLKSLGDLAMRRAELGEAAEHLEEARRKYEVVGNILGLANTLKSLGDLAMRRAELGKAAEHLEEARQKYEVIGDSLGLANTLKSLGDLAMRRAELGEAAERFEEARQIYEGIGANLGLANTLLSLGNLAMRRAELGKAAEHLEEARQKYEGLGDTLGLANTLKTQAEWHLCKDEVEQGARLLEDCAARYESLKDQEGLWETSLLQVKVLMRQGKSVEAKTLAQLVYQSSLLAGDLLIANDAKLAIEKLEGKP